MGPDNGEGKKTTRRCPVYQNCARSDAVTVRGAPTK